MVFLAETMLNRKSGGLASRRWLGAPRAFAVQESAEPEKGVYPGRAGMDRFPASITCPLLSSAASVVQDRFLLPEKYNGDVISYLKWRRI